MNSSKLEFIMVFLLLYLIFILIFISRSKKWSQWNKKQLEKNYRNGKFNISKLNKIVKTQDKILKFLKISLYLLVFLVIIQYFFLLWYQDLYHLYWALIGTGMVLASISGFKWYKDFVKTMHEFLIAHDTSKDMAE